MSRTPENPVDTSINRIVEGTSIKGDIKCESNIRIDGIFVGDLILYKNQKLKANSSGCAY
jgi:cytoskeletal protein CcmA (bactofilin family)